MRSIIVLLFSMAISLQAYAQEGDPVKIQDIRRFFSIVNLVDMAFVDIKNNAELQRRANPQIPNEFWAELLNTLKPDEFIDRVVPVYDKHFTHQEIKDWISFYTSPSGQAFLKKQPVILQESMVVGQAYVQEIGGPILKRLRQK